MDSKDELIKYLEEQKEKNWSGNINSDKEF
jgi:hypothetical protein